MFILAIFCPPVACLLAGRPISAIINLFLCILLWIPGVIHALMVVNAANADKRTNKIVKQMKKQAKAEANARAEASERANAEAIFKSGQ